MMDCKSMPGGEEFCREEMTTFSSDYALSDYGNGGAGGQDGMSMDDYNLYTEEQAYDTNSKCKIFSQKSMYADKNRKFILWWCLGI